MRALGRELLLLASLNTVTLLGAETVGRAYGGGMLKLEPREADALPVPAPALLEATRPALAALRPHLLQRLDEGRLLDAVRLVDEVLLMGGLGLGKEQVQALEKGHAMLRARRTARGRRGKRG